MCIFFSRTYLNKIKDVGNILIVAVNQGVFSLTAGLVYGTGNPAAYTTKPTVFCVHLGYTNSRLSGLSAWSSERAMNSLPSIRFNMIIIILNHGTLSTRTRERWFYSLPFIGSSVDREAQKETSDISCLYIKRSVQLFTSLHIHKKIAYKYVQYLYSVLCYERSSFLLYYYYYFVFPADRIVNGNSCADENHCAAEGLSARVGRRTRGYGVVLPAAWL